MSITDPGKIDAIAQEKNTLIMLLSDHLIWSKEQPAHLSMLQEKLNTYIRFISSGEYLEHTGGKRYDDFLIRIAFRYPPHRAFDEMLLLAKKQLDERHIRIIYTTEENMI